MIEEIDMKPERTINIKAISAREVVMQIINNKLQYIRTQKDQEDAVLKRAMEKALAEFRKDPEIRRWTANYHTFTRAKKRIEGRLAKRGLSLDRYGSGVSKVAFTHNEQAKRLQKDPAGRLARIAKVKALQTTAMTELMGMNGDAAKAYMRKFQRQVDGI